MVSVTRCESYDHGRVADAVATSLENLGGISKFIKTGERILIKPNLLYSASPDSAITTHPAVVEAVVRQVQSAGATAVIADSPSAGILPTESNLRDLMAKTGMLEVAERTGAEISLDVEPKHVTFQEGSVIKSLDVLGVLGEIDGMVNVPKLKTHVLMTLTCAVKNLFGLIFGLSKGGYHVKFADDHAFAQMLIDVLRYANPRLNVVDGIVALEGNGPGSHGIPRELGVLLAGEDAVEVDEVVCRIIGIDPMEVPIFQAAEDQSLWRPGEFQTVGDDFTSMSVSDFKKPDSRPGGTKLLKLAPIRWVLGRLLKAATTPDPVPMKSRCVACGICVRGCPKDAITIRNRLAVVDYSHCINCYCCHEMCPESAIELRFSTAVRVIRSLGVK